MKKELTAKQRRFVDAYAGNATAAAIAAGYSPKTAHSIGAENLRKPEIEKALKAREDKGMGAAIANRQQRQEFWTGVLRDKEQAMRDRLKASELLGKSEGDFLERVDLASSDGSMTPAKTIDLGQRTTDELMAMCKILREGRE